MNSLVEIKNENICIGDAIDGNTVREKTANLQAAMIEAIAKGEIAEVDPPLRHYFTEGVYAREMTIPAGTVIVGKIHKHAHLNFITKGKIAVVTEFGQQTITAPHTMVSQAGTKRVVFAIEDTVWTTIHVTPETDLEKIEDYVIAKSFNEFEQAALEDKTKQTDKQISDAWQGVLAFGLVERKEMQ